MSVQFHSPSYRVAQSDLAINISPLGLVELSDEEFEVHGPRLNRYAHYWAQYLGHHWAYRREAGEPQLTFNYCAAFSDYIVNFCFGKGVHFTSPKASEAIVLPLLHRVWEVDNDKAQILWEIGNMGSVTGDAFIKVAYEEPWEDSLGRFHPGRVRIIPLNSSHVFPEWHPHDRKRLSRVKIKYRFFGTSAEGTRQVFTYTEILTDNEIQEYVNDERIDVRPNPIGKIPVVHIPNRPVAGSPWGQSDLKDIASLNREYNEKATDISDIINYHAQPVTVITGAKANQLEQGARKVWAGLPADARVYNLELGTNLGGPLGYLELLKRAMHEMTGVPEAALGQMQPISNTSGVALSIQYGPLMNTWKLKTIQYGRGLRDVNELIILTLAVKEPHVLKFDPTQGIELKEGMYPELLPHDPLTYQTEVKFPDPMPMDVLVRLNELQMKMALQLESRKGALRELGEEFPDLKLQEIQDELEQDVYAQGALDMLRAHVQQAIYATTGMLPDGSAPAVGNNDSPSSRGDGPSGGPQAGPGRPPETINPLSKNLAKLLTEAYGTKLPQRRNPESPGAPES